MITTILITNSNKTKQNKQNKTNKHQQKSNGLTPDVTAAGVGVCVPLPPDPPLVVPDTGIWRHRDTDHKGVDGYLITWLFFSFLFFSFLFLSLLTHSSLVPSLPLFSFFHSSRFLHSRFSLHAITSVPSSALSPSSSSSHSNRRSRSCSAASTASRLPSWGAESGLAPPKSPSSCDTSITSTANSFTCSAGVTSVRSSTSSADTSARWGRQSWWAGASSHTPSSASGEHSIHHSFIHSLINPSTNQPFIQLINQSFIHSPLNQSSPSTCRGSPPRGTYLILDPHYAKGDGAEAVRRWGGCEWKDGSIWREDAYYNFCLPLLRRE